LARNQNYFKTYVLEPLSKHAIAILHLSFVFDVLIRNIQKSIPLLCDLKKKNMLEKTKNHSQQFEELKTLFIAAIKLHG
jgi:hypothetical protein